MKQLRVLFYKNNSEAENAFFSALQQCCTAENFFCPLRNEAEEQEFLPLIQQLIREQQAKLLCSFEYFPALSRACQQVGIFYFSYLYTTPTMSVFAEQVKNDCNVFLVADRALGEDLQKVGAGNVFYLPAAPCITPLPEGKSRPVASFPQISFVGELQQNNLYRNFSKLPEKMRGYLDGMLLAQSYVYGYSFYDKLLTTEFWEDMSTALRLEQAENKQDRCRYMVENFFFAPEATCLERRRMLKQLAEHYGEGFCMYAQEQTEEIPKLRQERVPVGRRRTELYLQTMNVNMTDRTNRTGISQNVWDIFAAGGILFSTYQPDLVELFVPGQDFVLYENERDLVKKLDYYLEHPKERAEIAHNGQKKVLEAHTWEQRVKEMLSLLQD